MDEQEEIDELLSYLRYRVEVWEDRAKQCVSGYAMALCRDMAKKNQGMIEQIRVGQLEAEEVTS